MTAACHDGSLAGARVRSSRSGSGEAVEESGQSSDGETACAGKVSLVETVPYFAARQTRDLAPSCEATESNRGRDSSNSDSNSSRVVVLSCSGVWLLSELQDPVMADALSAAQPELVRPDEDQPMATASAADDNNDSPQLQQDPEGEEQEEDEDDDDDEGIDLRPGAGSPGDSSEEEETDSEEEREIRKGNTGALSGLSHRRPHALPSERQRPGGQRTQTDDPLPSLPSLHHAACKTGFIVDEDESQRRKRHRKKKRSHSRRPKTEDDAADGDEAKEGGSSRKRRKDSDDGA